jgi:hypothetical protein
MWADIDHWFHKTMDRVSQRFTLSTRVVTLAWAVAIAFAVHLDASTLFRDLSSNLEIRTRLLASTDTINAEAERLAVRRTTRSPPVTCDGFSRPTAQINNELTATGLHLMPDYAKHAPNGMFSQDDLLPFVRSSVTSSGWDVNSHFFGVLFSCDAAQPRAPRSGSTYCDRSPRCGRSSPISHRTSGTRRTSRRRVRQPAAHRRSARASKSAFTSVPAELLPCARRAAALAAALPVVSRSA